MDYILKVLNEESSEWEPIEAIKGADGEPGSIGPTGPAGPQGEPGPAGPDGVGIESITLDSTSSEGVDTYLITYTDGTTSTFDVTNGMDYELTSEDEEDIADIVLAKIGSADTISY